MQKIFSSISAATGRQLKQSVKVFQILMLYRRLPAPGSDGQEIKHVEATRTGACVLTFIIETVNSVDRGALVVAAEDEEILWIFYLERQQQAYSLQALLSTVNIIAEK
jgi:hypothetical protein